MATGVSSGGIPGPLAADRGPHRGGRLGGYGRSPCGIGASGRRSAQLGTTATSYVRAHGRGHSACCAGDPSKSCRHCGPGKASARSGPVRHRLSASSRMYGGDAGNPDRAPNPAQNPGRVPSTEHSVDERPPIHSTARLGILTNLAASHVSFGDPPSTRSSATPGPSAPFEAGENGRIAVRVIDDRGNELLIVKKLKGTPR